MGSPPAVARSDEVRLMPLESSAPGNVAAPEGALAWTPGDGFIDDPEQLAAAVRGGVAAQLVEGGAVRGVEGVAPLSVVMRVERQLADAHAEIASLYERLRDTAEHAADRFTASR